MSKNYDDVVTVTETRICEDGTEELRLSDVYCEEHEEYLEEE